MNWAAGALIWALAACDDGATPPGDPPVNDGQAADAARMDAAAAEMGAPDMAPSEADRALPDAAPPVDASPPDAALPMDAALPDASLPDAAPPPPCGPPPNPALLADALTWIEANAPAVDSFLVSHCGERVAEHYFNGYSRDAQHELQSATKTFSAMLVGIALREGLIDSLDQPLTELLPAHAHLLVGPKAAITLRHVLTMTTGLRWVDFGVGNSFQRIAAAPDSVAFVLAEPLLTGPGEAFFYNTGSSHLLSAIVAQVSGMSTAAYAEARLFGPLGIDSYVWPALGDGVHQGGWGMYLTPRDFLAFGELIRNLGRVGAQQLIDPAFIDAATAWQVDNGQGGGYGFQMWIDTDEFVVDDIAAARGYGGQDCFVLEALDTVVVFNGNIQFPVEMAQAVGVVMNRFVLPALAR